MDTSGDFICVMLCSDLDEFHTVAQNLQGSPVVEFEVGKACGRSPSFRQPAHPAIYSVLTFAPEANLYQFGFPPKAVLRILRVRRHDTPLEGAAGFQEPFQPLPYCTPILSALWNSASINLILDIAGPFPARRAV